MIQSRRAWKPGPLRNDSGPSPSSSSPGTRFLKPTSPKRRNGSETKQKGGENGSFYFFSVGRIQRTPASFDLASFISLDWKSLQENALVLWFVLA